MVIKFFAERLRELRQEKGLSARVLGKAVGIADSTIIQWENQKHVPNIEHLAILAKFFGVSTDYLLGLED